MAGGAWLRPAPLVTLLFWHDTAACDLTWHPLPPFLLLRFRKPCLRLRCLYSYCHLAGDLWDAVLRLCLPPEPRRRTERQRRCFSRPFSPLMLFDASTDTLQVTCGILSQSCAHPRAKSQLQTAPLLVVTICIHHAA